MRVFIALEMPGDLRDRLGLGLAQLAREIRDVRWVAVQNLHLTLKFLGEVTQTQLIDLDRLFMTTAGNSAPFVLTPERVGFFCSGGEPTVIWLGLMEQRQLSALAAQVALDAQRLLPEVDRQPFRPHITLGRVKQPYRGPSLAIATQRIGALALPDWPVAAMSIIKSELTPRGPTYTTLSQYRLGGA